MRVNKRPDRIAILLTKITRKNPCVSKEGSMGRSMPNLLFGYSPKRGSAAELQREILYATVSRCFDLHGR